VATWFLMYAKQKPTCASSMAVSARTASAAFSCFPAATYRQPACYYTIVLWNVATTHTNHLQGVYAGVVTDPDRKHHC
jgi:hypothetical protein